MDLPGGCCLGRIGGPCAWRGLRQVSRWEKWRWLCDAEGFFHPEWCPMWPELSNRSHLELFAAGARLRRVVVLATVLWLSLLWVPAEAAKLEVGFAHADITPEVRAETPVWLAGYYPGRAATGVHDPLYARCVVLRTGTEKVAWVSVDLIGLQFPDVQQLRAQLRDFHYVLVASTHNHEGPDVIGVWGQSFLHRGVNDQYVESVVARIERAVRQAEQNLREAQAWYGTAADESLLGDRRQPVVKDGVLRLLRFTDPADDTAIGLVVQWNCHPEALGADNQLITADFPASTIATLGRRYACPVVYFSGAIGGLLAPPHIASATSRGNC